MSKVNPTYVPQSRIGVTFGAAVGGFKFITPAGVLPAAGALALGVTEHEWDNGDEGSVVTSGTILVKIKAELTKGALIASDIAGDGVLAVEGDYVNGILLHDAAADEVQEVFLTKFKLPVTAP
ncbi:MAG: hypothetical protein M9949_14175 [Candidatus Kapabacteria bacterium]|nr:hypothetical protein [Candidatus Kapabacteria bacterium]